MRPQKLGPEMPSYVHHSSQLDRTSELQSRTIAEQAINPTVEKQKENVLCPCNAMVHRVEGRVTGEKQRKNDFSFFLLSDKKKNKNRLALGLMRLQLLL